MKLICYRQMFLNKNLFIYISHLRCSHSSSDEILLMKKINITSYASVQYRHSIISKIEKLSTECGGYINDYNLFSDLSISLQILGIQQPNTLREFYQRLKFDIKELRLDNNSIKMLDNQSISIERYSLFILFQILFIDAKGDLRQNIPAIQN
ncbi:hypothetical protein I4U23_021829 [Adineta vaga]|nr:hypothetical protein I4U23_021829 [Adineta vaga]